MHSGFDDLEEALGFSRTYRIELADPDHSRQAIAALRDLRQVEVASAQTLATVPFQAQPPLTDRQARIDPWEAQRLIHAQEAAQIEPGDERVTVAVVDTGVSIGHPEIRRKLLAGYDTVDLGIGRLSESLTLVGDSRGLDFTPRDLCGHGSHVTGIIAAHGWRIPPGVGGRSLILPIRVLAAARSGAGAKVVGVGALSDIDCGMKITCDMGAKVINMSFGTPASHVEPGSPQPHAAVIRYAAHYGCVLVAAAGNSGALEAYYPAAYPEVISVGSVGPDRRRSSFSTYGDHLTLCAPGERIVSMGRQGYRVSSGTSHAAPLVSGAAALLVSHARRRNRELNGVDVKRILTESAVPLEGRPFHQETGYGMLDAAAALRVLQRYLATPQSIGSSR
jgi:subtilisin family serine protease